MRMGKVLGAMVMAGSLTAFANDTQSQTSSTTTSVEKSSSSPADSHEVIGKVLRTDSKMLYLDDQGAALPLKINSNTQFTDPIAKRVSDLKLGQQVRVSFVRDQMNNVATKIAPESGMGGSGSSDIQNQRLQDTEMQGDKSMQKDNNVPPSSDLPSHNMRP